jgi:hypothetical protein
MADISLHDFDNPDPRDARLQRWDYPNDQDNTFEVPEVPPSRASSLRGEDTQERQVSEEQLPPI